MKTDDQLRTDVLDEVHMEVRFPVGRVFVRAVDGKVTLSGQLPSFDAKQFADATVKRVAGVRTFESQIRIKRDALAMP